MAGTSDVISMVANRKNFICNIRAPNKEWYQVWLDFKEQTKSLGLDNCFVVLSLLKTWLKARKDTNIISQINSAAQIILIFQNNTFNYNVKKPRRERFLKDCSKNLPKCTICSMAFQAYIIEKARDLNMSFSFRDFLEINHDLFRKLILKLKNSGKILPLKARTNPRFYILSEWKDRYPTMTENNIVKPKFANNIDKTLKKQKLTLFEAKHFPDLKAKLKRRFFKVTQLSSMIQRIIRLLRRNYEV